MSQNIKDKLCPLSEDIKAELAKVRDQGISVLDNLQVVIIRALAFLHNRWRNIPVQNQKALWKHVISESKRVLVDKKHGGGATNGWTNGTFQNYMSRIKKAIIFQVDIYTAENETTEFLRECHNRAEKMAEEVGSVKIEKYMPKAIEEVKTEREARAAAAGKDKTSGYGFHGLPNQNEFKEDSLLALETIKQTYSYLEAIKDRIEGDSDAEALLRKVRKYLLAYKDDHEDEFEEFENIEENELVAVA